MNTNKRRVMVCILILIVLVGATGCQAVKNLDNFTQAISSIPDRIGDVFLNLVGSIGDVGSALANQVGNMVKNMTGR